VLYRVTVEVLDNVKFSTGIARSYSGGDHGFATTDHIVEIILYIPAIGFRIQRFAAPTSRRRAAALRVATREIVRLSARTAGHSSATGRVSFYFDDAVR
jgi:hypothetical protein